MQKKKSNSIIALTLVLTASIAFSSCSSSGVNESADAPAEDLPVVDAETDQLPPADGSLDGTVDPTSGAIDGTAVTSDPSMLPPEAAPPMADAPTDAPPSMDQPVASTDTTGAVAGLSSETTPSSGATEYTGPLNSSSTDTGAEPSAYTSSSSEATGSYTIRRGDTLMKIAYKVYGDIFRWKEILEANRDSISDTTKLVTGTTLKVDGDAQEMSYEGYEKYAIKTGDTLGTIATDIYGTKKRWKKLWKMNEKLIKDPNRIYAGFYLRYKFSAEDQQKKEQYQQNEGAAPLADGSQGGAAPEEQRNPSSVGMGQQPQNGQPTITSEPALNPQGQ